MSAEVLKAVLVLFAEGYTPVKGTTPGDFGEYRKGNFPDDIGSGEFTVSWDGGNSVYVEGAIILEMEVTGRGWFHEYSHTFKTLEDVTQYMTEAEEAEAESRYYEERDNTPTEVKAQREMEAWAHNFLP